MVVSDSLYHGGIRQSASWWHQSYLGDIRQWIRQSMSWWHQTVYGSDTMAQWKHIQQAANNVKETAGLVFRIIIPLQVVTIKVVQQSHKTDPVIQVFIQCMINQILQQVMLAFEVGFGNYVQLCGGEGRRGSL